MNGEFILGGTEGSHFLSLKNNDVKLTRMDKKKRKKNPLQFPNSDL
jgi:hypothetical protein